MKEIFFAFLLSLAVLLGMISPATAHDITRIIDGDTVEIAAPYLPDPLTKKLFVRILEIDTPEHGYKAKCQKEALLADKATEFTKHAINTAKDVRVELVKWDKYGGRVLGHIWVDGELLSHKLVEMGLARKYYGKKKSSWCN